MEPRHRQIIDACCEDVIPRLNMNALWPRLLENKVFNRDDVNIPRWKKNLSDKEIVKDIFLTIKTRGPHAFKSLICSLKESGHEVVAILLEKPNLPLRATRNYHDVPSGSGTSQPTPQRNAEGSATEHNGRNGDSFFHSLQNSNEPLKIQVRKATEFLDGPVYKTVQRYPMRSKPRGLVLMITNINYLYTYERPRTSAEYDEQNLKNLFQQMGFQVESFRDLTGQELIDRVKEFSRREDLRKVDSCFVIISSHGNMNEEQECTEILGIDCYPSRGRSDFRTVLCSEIIDCFASEECRHLVEKPKIFMFQICRGNKKQKAVVPPRHVMDSCTISESELEGLGNRVAPNKISVRNYTDTLIAHATLPGHVAFRDTITGSWFIQILCEVFMNYACTTHLRDLLDMVDERLSTVRTNDEECQTLTITSIGFNKHCYLHPGLFEEV